MKLNPRFRHDCEACAFLGHFRGYDVYHCENEAFSHLTGGSLIARHGDEGSDYWAMQKNMFISIVDQSVVDRYGSKSAMAAAYEALFPEKSEKVSQKFDKSF